jgi:hypothetical protein
LALAPANIKEKLGEKNVHKNQHDFASDKNTELDA